jgi:hypothetical protein
VLLSDTFLADHCFKIEPARWSTRATLGLAFQPVPERKKPDIKGVLWMDGKTAELRTLEFNYTWLPNDVRWTTVGRFRSSGCRAAAGSSAAGGSACPNSLSAHGAAIRRHADFARPKRNADRHSRCRRGGAVPLTTLLNQAGTVHGTVVLDTVSNRPIAGITVALEGTADSTHTAVDGRSSCRSFRPAPTRSCFAIRRSTRSGSSTS